MTAPESRGPGIAGTPHELFERWQKSSDRGARDELVARYMPLARRLAARYRRSYEPVDDLVQVASLGLVNAIDRFDPARGTAFVAFAVPTIVGELKRYFRDLGWSIAVERAAKERVGRVAAARSTLAAGTGRSPTVAQLAQFLELSVEEVTDALQILRATDTLSFDDEVRLAADDSTISRAETVGGPDARLAGVDDRLTISAAAQALSKLERTVIYLRFNEDLTQTQTASRIDVSQMHVSRLERRALARLGTEIGDVVGG